MGVNKTSEAFDSARSEYIKGYEEKNTTIFPTLDLVAKEFSLTLSTLRKKAANEGWYQKRKQYQSAREEYEIRKQFRGKYSNLAKISRNTLVFVEYCQYQNILQWKTCIPPLPTCNIFPFDLLDQNLCNQLNFAQDTMPLMYHPSTVLLLIDENLHQQYL